MRPLLEMSVGMLADRLGASVRGAGDLLVKG